VFDFGDGFVSVYGKSYCVDDYGTVVPTANAIKAAIEYARDFNTTIKFLGVKHEHDKRRN
jgi:hypothetical protein